MRPLDTLRPTTVAGIKRLAKQIGKRDGIKHGHALDAAALQAGFQDFRQAVAAIESGENQSSIPVKDHFRNPVTKNGGYYAR